MNIDLSNDAENAACHQRNK